MSDLLRVYLDPAEIGKDGYPLAWHNATTLGTEGDAWSDAGQTTRQLLAIKDTVRERDGHRCLRCGHPYRKGEHGNGEWSPCEERCTHRGPVRVWFQAEGVGWQHFEDPSGLKGMPTEAAWRILTVHHLTGVKHDCRWWNLVSLCQRCHLTIQGKVYMDRAWNKPHSEWFRPFAAGFYAWKYLDEDLTQEETLARIDELLALEQTMEPLF